VCLFIIIIILKNVLIRVTLSQKTVAGALNNEKRKIKAVSAVSLECQMTMKTALSSVPGKTAAMMTQPG